MRKFFGLGLLVLCCISAETVPPDNGLVVHEWGTFTSVADGAGNPQAWLPLASASDLPCFVHRFDGRNLKVVLGDTVRMETPVLYFYAAHPVTADVKVHFTKGMITEWYPQASVKPSSLGQPGAIEWNSIALSQSRAALPGEADPSHYYAARETDSLMVETGGEHDKMLFYRGVGNFAIPLHPRVGPEGKVQVGDARAIVFENRGQNDGNAEVVRRELYAALVDSGLYPKEAHAMIETWRDSWFEEGLRVFYLVPRELVDEVLPITISPRPDKLVRTFVGRIELLAPWMRQEIGTALRTGDTETLARRGRFLQAFIEQMGNAAANPKVSEWLNTKENEGARRFLSGECKP
jgi:hypothetical protein